MTEIKGLIILCSMFLTRLVTILGTMVVTEWRRGSDEGADECLDLDVSRDDLDKILVTKLTALGRIPTLGTKSPENSQIGLSPARRGQSGSHQISPSSSP